MRKTQVVLGIQGSCSASSCVVLFTKTISSRRPFVCHISGTERSPWLTAERFGELFCPLLILEEKEPSGGFKKDNEYDLLSANMNSFFQSMVANTNCLLFFGVRPASLPLILASKKCSDMVQPCLQQVISPSPLGHAIPKDSAAPVHVPLVLCRSERDLHEPIERQRVMHQRDSPAVLLYCRGTC